MPIIADDTSPTMARFIIVRVMYGRLYDKIVPVKLLPPTTTGSHPSKKIITEFVAKECVLSII